MYVYMYEDLHLPIVAGVAHAEGAAARLDHGAYGARGSHTHTHTYIYMYIYMNIYMYVYMYVCICVCILTPVKCCRCCTC